MILEIRLWSRKQAISGNPDRSHYLSLTLTIFGLPFFVSVFSHFSFLRMTQMTSEQFESIRGGKVVVVVGGTSGYRAVAALLPHLISELKPESESLHSLLF